MNFTQSIKKCMTKDYINREEDPEILDIDHEILRESANILTDFIEYSYQPVVVSLKSAG